LKRTPSYRSGIRIGSPSRRMERVDDEKNGRIGYTGLNLFAKVFWPVITNYA
jgi:hypothetical protein